MDKKTKVLATTRMQYASNLYKIVDRLNRTLKEKDLMFGLALDANETNTEIFTIYRT